MHRPQYNIEKTYPELFDGLSPLLTPQDITDQRAFLTTQSVSQSRELRKELNTYDLHDIHETEYKMAVLEGTSRNVFVGFSEYATHARKDRLAQLLSIRALCDPNAWVVFQAHSAWGQNAMNLSHAERATLRSGSALPIVERTIETLKSHHLLRKTNIHIVGSSLGATLGTELASQIQTRSLTVLETPNIMSRTYTRLAKDFLASGSHLYKNINVGKLETDASSLHQGLGALTLFGLNALHPDNLATVGLVRHNTHQESILAALERNPHMGIVRAWTERSAISPHEENIAISEALKTHNNGAHTSQIESYEFTSEFASHNSSNIPILLGALTRRAVALSKAPKHPLY